MTSTDYPKALKLGEKAYKNAQAKGSYPYLPALDSFIDTFDIMTESYMGLMDIPLDQIVGTKTAGRQTAFACNFMPLMPVDSEFAMKWSSLYEHQMEDGINDPIVVYEFMNRYYVQEGNKRVSVLKFLGAFSIEGTVTRIIPKLTDDPAVRIFYEYMDFYRKSAVNYIRFTKEGSYAALIKSCGFAQDHFWTDQDREDFSSRYLRFSKYFEEKGGKKLDIFGGDAFLLYISVYPYELMDDKTNAELKTEIGKIWEEFSVIEETTEEALVLEPDEKPATGSGILKSVLSVPGKKKLIAGFVHEKNMLESGWVYSHELGRMHLEKVFGDKVATKSYFPESDRAGAALITQAIEDGCDIVFTTSEVLLPESLKAALSNPSVKILNCCLNMPYRSMRTYYGRMYEAKFLAGLVAGALAEDDKIAYAADFPIYGSVAAINAFALGASMTNPRAKIHLHWNCIPGADFRQFVSERDIHIISNVDTIRPGSGNRDFGLYRLQNGKREYLAAPIWNWGKFYERIISDIQNGSWQSDKKNRKAMNYWWGLSGGMVDIILSEKLPSGVKCLVEAVKAQVMSGAMNIFEGLVFETGSENKKATKLLSFSEIIKMHQLADNVIGHIPEKEELNDEAKRLAQIQGIREPEEEKKLMEAAVDVRGISEKIAYERS